MSKHESEARILLLGLEGALAIELGAVLRRQNRAVFTATFQSPPQALNAAVQVAADVVFCGADRERYVALLDEMRERQSVLPVVVVSRTPEVSDWLDAIEAGATDYCAAPFESGHVEWILSTALTQGSGPTHLRAAG